ncbi:hypothetical protein K491DRAFT_692342 [Lophiostoma macrostomum CBS 122681]|uniref:Uncharacterized protein n=1 Tax=Lophiostoma macrostomum CBS 122681 TaxID=1314788 RepID=A0A6A6TA70_9PLEO|nr:hypothetical protein K491DRAFT_692342 [Lophiostoma macrostomum CBS 122681]
MSPSGWGGVWERQRERAGEYEADVGDLVCGGGCEDEGEEGEGGGEGEDERVGGYESEEGSEGGSWSSETSDERFWEDEEEDGYEYLRADQHRPDGVEEERVFGLKLLEEGLRGYLTPDEEEFLIEL